MSGTSVRLFRPGLVPYREAWKCQEGAADALRHGLAGEALFLLQHPPVYTLGRRARREHVLVGEAELRRRGADVVETDRGGGVTFHGPGQLIGYPVLDLRRRSLLPGDYVRLLERTLTDALAALGIRGQRVAGRPGVWVGTAKLAAVGVRVHGGVTTHGFALNVSNDLSWFTAIVPCGLAGAGVTSLAALLDRAPDMAAVEAEVCRAFERAFACRLQPEAAASAVATGTLLEAGVGR
jgi:lipoyl(octanoyl) transferase